MHPSFPSSIHAVQIPVLRRVQLFMKLHSVAGCWINPTLKSYKKISSGGNNKRNLPQDFVPLLVLFLLVLIFFLCKPRHHWNHDPPANSSMAAGTLERTFKASFMPHRVAPSVLLLPSRAPEEVVFCGYSTPKSKLNITLSLSREEVQDMTIIHPQLFPWI